jgi:16S rRNA (cytosine1402-N4)-methyltransferase
LIAFDRDPVAVVAGQAVQDPRFELVHAPFSDFAEALAERGVEQVDGVLLDLGCRLPSWTKPGGA